MARLIVEESGKRRAFNVGDGVLTIGSGAEARLRVEAQDVAEIHAEIQVQAGKAVLRARPGVVAPTVGGEAVVVEAPVGYGEEMRIGSVRMWLEDESQAAGHAAPPAAPQLAVGAAGASAPVRRGVDGANVAHGAKVDRALRREQAIQAARKRGDKSVVQRTRPRVERGLPGGAVAALILVGAVLVAFVGWKLFASEAAGPPPAAASLAEAARMIDRGSYKDARTKLDALGSLQGEHEGERKALYARLDDLLAQAAVDREHAIGTKYLDTKLAKYEEFYLQGKPSKARARVFLKRCREFKQRWPDHPQRDWVERQERRFEGTVNLGDPPTFEDVAWEVECLTKTNPKYFGAAFEVLDAFLAAATGEDVAKAQELHNELVEARQVEFVDRLEQARYEFQKKGDETQSVAELIYIITRFGDEAMADEAAERLLDFESLAKHLRGWKEMRPDEYEVLILHPDVAAYVRKVEL
jgi:hypothetical protein